MEKEIKKIVIKAGISGVIIGVIATTLMVVALTLANR